MKQEILENGIEKTIDSKTRNFNNMIFITFISSLTAFICLIVLFHTQREKEALKYQVSQRDVIIAEQKATINELTFDNFNLVNSIK
jgi:hypothetical protein